MVRAHKLAVLPSHFAIPWRGFRQRFGNVSFAYWALATPTKPLYSAVPMEAMEAREPHYLVPCCVFLKADLACGLVLASSLAQAANWRLIAIHGQECHGLLVDPDLDVFQLQELLPSDL